MKHLNVLQVRVREQKCRSNAYYNLKKRRVKCLEQKLVKFNSFNIPLIAKIKYERLETENFKVSKNDNLSKRSLYQKLVWHNFLNKMILTGRM